MSAARPVATYARKRKGEDAAWREIAPVESKNDEQSPPAPPKEQPKKQPAKPGQATILSFVGKSAPDPFDFAQSAKRKPAASLTAQPAGKQTFLDFGQRNLATQACVECGLTYSAGVEEDEALHAKFHREHAQAVAFPGWKNENVVRTFLADGARIVRVSAEQSLGAYKRKMSELHAFINRELAYSELPVDADAAGERRVTYLYIVNKKVQGCVIAEPIEKAFSILPSRRSDSQQSDEAAGSPKKKRTSGSESPLRCSTTAQRAQLGISRIWVAKGQRRKGIGTRLLDAARSSMFYGITLKYLRNTVS